MDCVKMKPLSLNKQNFLLKDVYFQNLKLQNTSWF